MRFAICNETFRHHDFVGSCAEAKRHGYSGLEVAPFTMGNVLNMTAKEAAQMGSIVRDHDLQMVGFHWLLAHTEGFHLTSPDAKTAARTFDYARHLAELCAEKGGGIMVWGSPGQRTTDPSWDRGEVDKRVIDFFQRLTPHLADAGVVIAMEFLGANETNYLNTADETIELLKKIDSVNVRLHLDVKAMAANGRHIPGIVTHSLPWTAHFHANDPNLRGPGMGEVPFPPIAEALIKGDYQGWVSVEVFDTGIEPDVLAAESMRNLRTAFSS